MGNEVPVLLEEEIILQVIKFDGGVLLDPSLGFGGEVGIINRDKDEDIKGCGFGTRLPRHRWIPSHWVFTSFMFLYMR